MWVDEMRTFPVFLALLCGVTAAQAQQRQPAQMTTLPTTTPQEFDLLDSTGKWLPFGTANGGVFTGNGAGTDVRSFGCAPDDGTYTKDQTACIQRALDNAPDCVIIPASTYGFYVAGTLAVKRCLRGTTWNPSNSTTAFSNTSRIACNNQVAQPCVVVNLNVNLSAQIENITLLGIGATPVTCTAGQIEPCGSIGFQWKGGFNLILSNFQTANFDTCAMFGPTVGPGLGPLSAHATNTYFSRCQKHYVVVDGIPEIYFMGGRWGENGGTDYNSADDFVYATKSITAGAGGGPNGIVIDTVQINPGGKSVGCGFRWGGFTGTGGAFEANKIINSHVEALDAGYTGSATTGMICVDNTLIHFPGMIVANNELQFDGGFGHPMFNIDTTVPWDNQAYFANNRFGTGSFVLTIGNVTSFHGPVFINNYFAGGGQFVAGDSTANIVLAANMLGGYLVSGQWSSLILSGNIGTPNLTNASGNILNTSTNAISGTALQSIGLTGSVQMKPSGGTQPADGKNWDMIVGSANGNLNLRSVSDDYANASNWLSLIRGTGYSFTNASMTVGVPTTFNQYIAMAGATYATLPTCTAGQGGRLAFIIDGPVTTYGANVTSGGSTTRMLVLCNGTNWTAH